MFYVERTGFDASDASSVPLLALVVYVYTYVCIYIHVTSHVCIIRIYVREHILPGENSFYREMECCFLFLFCFCWKKKQKKPVRQQRRHGRTKPIWFIIIIIIIIIIILVSRSLNQWKKGPDKSRSNDIEVPLLNQLQTLLLANNILNPRFKIRTNFFTIQIRTNFESIDSNPY